MGVDETFWQGRAVLVTGATGFLGGWLVKDLCGRGASVVALIRDGTSASMLVREGWVQRINSVHGSLSDLDLLRRVMCEYEVRTVFHLAAQAIVGVANADPVGALEANVRGTWNLLEAARQAGVKQIVAASSDKAYGASNQLPYLETHPMQGSYPYDVSKSCADLICRMYAQTYELPVCVTRCGNLFGGGDLNFSRTIPGVVLATLRGERFRIRSDGKFVRDFLYVEDAVSGYVRLAERMSQDPSLAGESFNLSLGIRATVLDIVEKVLSLMNRSDLEPIIENRVSAEIREQYMVADKARERLGWIPEYGLDRGLEETIRWYSDFLVEPHGIESVGFAGAAPHSSQ
ncbi:MAG: GDP-mannose 4,6-dehydratase [Phycisphaerae bacterium]